jgi:P-type conjugative transfer protein TrbJ
MKTTFLTAFAWVLFAPCGFAQWVVYDPTVHAQQIIDQAEDVAKYVEMINNQVQQIQRLTSQLEELQQYNKAFGDPSRILNVAGVTGLVQDLKKTPVGKTITDLERIADGVEALTYDANGLYQRIGKTFTTPSGKEIQRATDEYKSFQVVNKATENYTNVTADVLLRRKVLKDEIAATTQQLQAATTSSEAQKLSGVLVGLNSALIATDKEIDQALALSVVQDIENRNDLAAC